MVCILGQVQALTGNTFLPQEGVATRRLVAAPRASCMWGEMCIVFFAVLSENVICVIGKNEMARREPFVKVLLVASVFHMEQKVLQKIHQM